MSAVLAVCGAEHCSEMTEPDHEPVELALVLPRWQIEALATTARSRGLTAGQLLRRLVNQYCATQSDRDQSAW
jgi:hypothetical protein